MSRSVRRVPLDWRHPRDSRGHFVPMHKQTHAQALRDYETGREDFESNPPSDFTGTYAEWNGEPPDPKYHFPEFAPGTAIGWQMYEEVSEGTPISPVCESPEALARWLSDNQANAGFGQTATYDSWLRMIRAGWAPTGVMVGGELISGVNFEG